MAYLKIIRPHYGILAAVTVYIASLIAGLPAIPSLSVLLGIAAAFCITSGAIIVNDIADFSADAIRKPGRPIPSGELSRKMAGFYAAVLFFISIVFSIKISEQAFYVCLLAIVMSAFYSAMLKKIAITGNVIISALFALLFVFAGSISGNYSIIVLLATTAFLASMGKELYQSIDQALGDKDSDTRTAAIVFGTLKTRLLGAVFVIASVIASFAPFLFGIMNPFYIGIILVADSIFLFSVAGPMKYSSKLLKIAMLIMIAAFFFGSVSVPNLLGSITSYINIS